MEGETLALVMMMMITFIILILQVNLESGGGNDCIEETSWKYSRFSCILISDT